MKLVEVQSTKEFASTFLNDIFFKMAVNRVLDAAPEFDFVRCKDCKMFCPEEIRKLYNTEKYCMRNGWIVNDDDFCSYGERKEE